MDLNLFISHLAYIVVTFGAGLVVGWYTKPQFTKLIEKFKSNRTEEE